MTGAYTASQSFIDVLNTAYSLYPTLTLTNLGDTRLVLQGRFSDWQQQEYQGLPATGTVTGGFRIANSLFPGPQNIDKSYSRTQSGTALFDHTINETWSGSLQARASKTQFAELAQNYVGTDFAANTPSVPPSSWNLLNLQLYQEQTEFTVAGNMLAQFDYATTRNKVVLRTGLQLCQGPGPHAGRLQRPFHAGPRQPRRSVSDVPAVRGTRQIPQNTVV